jgi:cation:H+ antiporter
MVLEELAVLVVSIFVLSNASSFVVDNIARLSRFFGISQVAMGFMMLAVATSLPELSVSVASSAAGQGAIAAGNVFGSNIANILLVLGTGAFLYGLKMSREHLGDIALVLLATTLISAYIIASATLTQTALGPLEGAALLVIFALYVWRSLRRKAPEDAEGNGVTKEEALRSFILFGIGVVLVIASSGFVVNSAVSLAASLGVAESFIGATMIAVGTSLPELSIDLQAIRKKHYGIALGDAIGSNMANLTLVLGVGAVIHPISIVLPVFIAALLFAIAANIMVYYAASANGNLGKKGGAVFLATYVIYIIAIFLLQVGELSR